MISEIFFFFWKQNFSCVAIKIKFAQPKFGLKKFLCFSYLLILSRFCLNKILIVSIKISRQTKIWSRIFVILTGRYNHVDYKNFCINTKQKFCYQNPIFVLVYQVATKSNQCYRIVNKFDIKLDQTNIELYQYQYQIKFWS